MDISIRAATVGDRDIIAEFNLRLAQETEALALDRERLARGVTEVLTDPAKGRYLLAVVDGEVAGQLMITCEWSDWRNGMFWWIQSVYVRRERRRAGLFKRLYEYVTRLAADDPGVCGVRLYVDKHNERAQNVYHALGMGFTGYRVMECVFAR